MYKILITLVATLCVSSISAGTLRLSEQDSLLLFESVILPHVKTETITKNNIEVIVHTSEATTSDAILGFRCRQKLRSGLVAQTQCELTLNTEAEAGNGNKLKGDAYRWHFTVGSATDVNGLRTVFKQAGACRTATPTRLHATQERRTIKLSNGQEVSIPLFTVQCTGTHQGLKQMEFTLVPRVER